MEHNQHLIIGGTTKAATTSLFNYLADHPEVCASTLKETRFFIDTDYPIQPQVETNWEQGIQEYEIFFKAREKPLRLDASPDYLYSVGTPHRIKNMLPNAKVIFILRDPVTRMISWYKYAKQKGGVSNSLSFDSYFEMQIKDRCFEHDNQQEMESGQGTGPIGSPSSYVYHALEQGCYADYIKNYFDVLGRDNVRIHFYEDFCSNPSGFLRNICDFVSINPSFYDDYDFKVFNRSLKMRNAKFHQLYSSFRKRIRKQTHNLPIHKYFRQLRQWVEPAYYSLNSQGVETVQLSPELNSKLSSYYSPSVDSLEQLLGYSVPWPR